MLQLHLLIILSFVSGAYLSVIIARGDTSVEFGGDTSLSCALSNPSGVKQVSWERVRAGDDAETLATFSERYKDYVHQEYVGKVTITASFNSSSIVIKNVTFEDEACYICSFKLYPSGPKRETLCLTVKGISEITASVNPASGSDSDVTVSCLAKGKPTPILQWKSTEKDQTLHLSGSNNIMINSDGSNTTTSYLKLPISQFHGKSVECVAQSDNVEKSYQISLSGKNDEVTNNTSRRYITTVLVLVFMLIIIFVITLICLYKRLHGTTLRKISLSVDSLQKPVVIECCLEC
ncbi:OX-2 membrane glycoprotein-like [Triplophysa rosa]|uniref:OX-2 membrane glycoprotein-like n=1 Tax=Triplophysa rosa TaxID=992332 RepID=UPI002545C7B6|nr:OX-2 membrane glycoprotein-like [Triplophysa rosa]